MAKKSKKKATPKPRYTKKGTIPNNGRPPKPLDWDIVRNLCEAHCTQAEVAAKVNLNITTLKDRCIKENGITFAQFYKEGLETGNASIRAVQHSKALKGDGPMLIWLGKNRLKQSDRHEVEVNVKPYVIEAPNGQQVMKLGAQQQVEGDVIDTETIEGSEETYYASDELAAEGDDGNTKDEQSEPG